MLTTVFSYLVFFYLTIFGLIAIGHFFYSCFVPEIEKPYQRYFTKVSIGLVLFTVFFATYFSNGHSILVLFFLILMFFINEKQLIIKRSVARNLFRVPNRKKLIFFLTSIIIPGVVFFAWEALFNFKGGDFNFVVAPRDYHHYSNISEALSITGQENTFGLKNIILKDYHGVTPYHYFEIWFANAIGNLFGTFNIVSLMAIVYPLLYWVSYLGFCAMWETFSQVERTQKVMSFLFIGLGGLCLEAYSSIPYIGGGSFITINPIETFSRKYIIYYLFVIASWLFFHYKKNTTAIISILCLPIIFIGSLPAVLSGVIIFIILAFSLKKITNKEAIRMLLYIFLVSISIGLFYVLNSKPSISLDNFEAIFSIETWGNIKTYKTLTNIYILTTVQYVFYFLPFIILISIFYKRLFKGFFNLKSKTILFFFIVVMYFSSLSSWAFLHLLGNANQFFSNGVAIILNVWIIGLLINIYFKLERKRQWVYLLAIIFIIFPNIIYSLKHNFREQYESDQYLNEITKLIDHVNSDNVLGGIYFSKEETDQLTERMNKALHIFPLAHYTNYANKTVDVQNLSVFDIPPLKNKLNESRFSRNVEMEPFYRFVQKQKTQSQFLNIEKSQLDFINQFNLKFLIFRKDVKIPKMINEMAQQIILDSKSGDQFVLLK